ncbi:wefK [Clostridium sp. CAG:389]|nr:wefK [Clostridium sp. CAG:389]
MRKRIEWIDLLKVMACFLVVLLHSINYGLNGNEYVNGLWIYYLGSIAIPIFFMINGYLQLDRNLSYKYIISKIIKIFIITIFWCSGLYLIKYILHDEINNYFVDVFGSLMQKGILPHLWFLGTLIIINLFLPLLHKIYNMKHFKIVLIGLFFINIFLDLTFIYLYKKCNFILKDNIIQTFRLWNWMLYFFIGGGIKKYSYNIKLNNNLLYFVTACSIIIMIMYESFFSYKLYGNLYAESFYGSIFVIISSTLIFICFSRIKIENKFITKLSSLTMGVYIIHVTILRVITKLLTFNNNYLNIICLLMTFIISCIISYVISKIPKVKELIKL